MQASLISGSSATEIASEPALVRLALELGALEVGGPLSGAESSLCMQAADAASVSDRPVFETANLIEAGGDPLGDVLCRLRSASERRRQGAFYTPPPIVRPMVDWVLSQEPARVIDPGCGSGRFSAAIARFNPNIELWSTDLDPLQTLLTRATLAVLKARNVHVVQTNYLELNLPPCPGRSAFICNPPYVRHHALTQSAKAWAATAAGRLGHSFSGLAGLHAHFFLATAQMGKTGDVGCFVTSAEWLDVGYGAVIRSLLLNGLGGCAIHVVEPSSAAFEDVQSTAAITCFQFGVTPEAIRIRRVSSTGELGKLDGGLSVPSSTLAASTRWSPLSRRLEPSDETLWPLGDLVEVHRGIVTGANDYFVLAPERADALGIMPWCTPVISDGREILESGGIVRRPGLKVLLQVPKGIDRKEFPALDAYLRLGETPAGHPRAVSNRYIATHRRPWWVVGGGHPPPIVATYMARQAPVFALNPDGLALLNIAHGLYPKKPMGSDELGELVRYLNSVRQRFQGQGRTYQGGLEKFEPREMEALLIGFAARSGAADG